MRQAYYTLRMQTGLYSVSEFILSVLEKKVLHQQHDDALDFLTEQFFYDMYVYL